MYRLHGKIVSFIGALIILVSFSCSAPDVTQGSDDGYHTFERYLRFEPSGIARIPDTDNYIVIDDKDSDLQIFELADNDLLHISKQPLELEYKDKKDEEFKVKAKKLEGITASRKDPGKFYAITSFDRNKDSYRKLIRIGLEKSKKDPNKEEPYAIDDLQGLEIYSPSRAIDEEEEPWSKVEGLALTPDEKYLIIGVREMGEDYKNSEYRVIILRYELDKLNKRPKTIVNIDLNAQGVLKRPEGISSIEFDPNLKKYIVLTSYESSEFKESKRDEVGGHIWLLPEDLKEADDPKAWKNYPNKAFTHKPEGVSLTSTPGKVIVVFDDDNDRKCIRNCDNTFPQKPNEGVFKIVELDSLK